MHAWTQEKSRSVAPFRTAELESERKRSSGLRMQSALVGIGNEGDYIRKK